MADEPSIWGRDDLTDLEMDDSTNAGNAESNLGQKDLIGKMRNLLKEDRSLPQSHNDIRRYQMLKKRMDLKRIYDNILSRSKLVSTGGEAMIKSDGSSVYKDRIAQKILIKKGIMNLLGYNFETKNKLGLRNSLDSIVRGNTKFTSDVGNTEESDTKLLAQLMANKNSLPRLYNYKNKHLGTRTLFQSDKSNQRAKKRTNNLTQLLLDKMRDLNAWRSNKYGSKNGHQSPILKFREVSNGDIGSVYEEIVQMINNPIFYPNGDISDQETRLNLISAILKIVKMAEREENQNKLEFEKIVIGQSF